jgi:hypothetical protein
MEGVLLYCPLSISRNIAFTKTDLSVSPNCSVLSLRLHIPYEDLCKKKLSIPITQMYFWFYVNGLLTVVARDASGNTAPGAAKIAQEQTSKSRHLMDDSICKNRCSLSCIM